MSVDLGKLRDPQVREALLLAEVAAWLHDMGKCADAFLQPGGMGFNAQNCQGNPRVNPHKAVFQASELQVLPYWPNLSPQRGQCARLAEANHTTAIWRTFIQIGFSPQDLDKLVRLGAIGEANIRELILWGRPLVANRYTAFNNVLTHRTHLAATLGWAHKTAHLEKEDLADGGFAGRIASPFGFEKAGDIFQNLNERLADVLVNLKPRDDFLGAVKENFRQGPGDTRWPINEVTLWDWSSIVAALYKSELARCVLTGQQRQPPQIAWRLFSLRTDGLGYLLSAPSIPDLLARKELLTDAWDRVQTLLEETYPLGLEVYRDENGPVFVVPDVDNLPGALTDAQGKTLREYILEAFAQGTVDKDPCLAVQGEIVPDLHLDPDPWKGQPALEELPPIGKNWKDRSKKGHLERKPALTSNPRFVTSEWGHLLEEICTVCGLRPQGPSTKAKERNVCDVCEQRRADRAKEWAANIGRALLATIWLDEVADENGRLALVVGQFDLEHWLSGVLVRTLAVREPNDQNGHTDDDVAKNPSFARLRRIWETTRDFWEKVLRESDGKLGDRPRLWLPGTFVSASSASLRSYHPYELEVQGRRVAVLWVSPDATDDGGPLRHRGGFWVIENLAYLNRVYGRDVKSVLADARRQPLPVYIPPGYGRRTETVAYFKMDGAPQESEEARYIPLIPILAEPRTFMALVPADRALDVVRAIRIRYEREMGKVRNRLPLHLGIVYADAHLPLRAVLDAGRRMLEQTASAYGWQVVNVCEQPANGGTLPDRFQADAQGQFARWYEIDLEKDGCRLTWYVPAVMGDGKTEDRWYPYVFLADTAEPQSRPRYFRAENPWNSQHPWLVHAGELERGDIVYFTPATLDYVWLGSSGKRFEIAYNNQDRRCALPRRPYLLDELDALDAIWCTLSSCLTTTQIHALNSLIESKREEWQIDGDDDGVFEQFCRDVLVNAEWRDEPWGDGRAEWLNTWSGYAVRGWIADAVELYHHVMKQQADPTSRRCGEGEAA